MSRAGLETAQSLQRPLKGRRPFVAAARGACDDSVAPSEGAARRLAFSRKYVAKRAVEPSSFTTSASIHSASGISTSCGGGRSLPENRKTMPSSPQTRSTSAPGCIAESGSNRHAPRGVNPPSKRRQNRNPPISHLVQKRLDDDGGVTRHDPGRSDLVLDVAYEVFRQPVRQADGRAPDDRLPHHAPASATLVRDAPPRCQTRTDGPVPLHARTGIRAGAPGAGVTSTRSCVISTARQEEAPSKNTSPGRVSKTISSSNSPTRFAVEGLPSARKTP